MRAADVRIGRPLFIRPANLAADFQKIILILWKCFDYNRIKGVKDMSNREKCIAILDSFDEGQLANIAAMLQAAKDAVSEAADDAFCSALYERYRTDPDRGQAIPLEAAAKTLGVAL